MEWKSKKGIGIIIGIAVVVFILALLIIWLINRIQFQISLSFDFWTITTIFMLLIPVILLIRFIVTNSTPRMSGFTLLSTILLIIFSVFFLRWIVKKKYRCDPGAQTILFVGGIIAISGLIFYALGGDFRIFDVTRP